MANKELLPKGEYKIKTVGPSRDWSFDGDKGKVNMATDSVQFEGHEQYWVDVNRQASADAPTEGTTLTGSIEQDEAGKYPPKFVKERKGGSFGGGGKAGPGAIWSAAVATATHLVVGYYTASNKKPKDFDEFLSRVEQVAPKVNTMVDKFVGAKPAETTVKSDGEAGVTAGGAPEKPAATGKSPKADVVIEDISDEELDPEDKW